MIVEYRALDAKHKEPYTIEVDYMDRDEMRVLLRDHLQSIRQCYFRLEKPNEPSTDGGEGEQIDNADDSDGSDAGNDAGATAEGEEQLNKEDILKLQKANHSAQQTFDALFKGHDNPSKEFLIRNDSPQSEAEILETLVQKAREGLTNRPGGLDAIQFTEASNNLESCRKLLDVLTSDTQSDAPAIWPFVKLIRFVETTFTE